MLNKKVLSFQTALFAAIDMKNPQMWLTRPNLGIFHEKREVRK